VLDAHPMGIGLGSLPLAIQEEAAGKEAEDERNQERARAIVLFARVRALESRLMSVTEADMSRPEEYGEVATAEVAPVV